MATIIQRLQRKYNRKPEQPRRQRTSNMVTPIYSGPDQIGILNHATKQLKLFHNPHTFFVTGTQPGCYVKNQFGRTIGHLGYNGQMHRYYR